MRRLRSGIVLAFALHGIGACSTAESDCSCVVEVGSERRTLSCGQSLCLDGSLTICDENGQSAQRGACTAANGNATAQAGSAAAEQPTMPAPHACTDLLTYCNGSCTSPPNPSADCQATASAGDEAACESWPLTNGILCHP